MASGSIIGVCPYCGDHIWEDENYVVNMRNGMFHFECEKEKLSAKSLEKRVRQLEIEIEKLKKLKTEGNKNG